MINQNEITATQLQEQQQTHIQFVNRPIPSSDDQRKVIFDENELEGDVITARKSTDKRTQAIVRVRAHPTKPFYIPEADSNQKNL